MKALFAQSSYLAQVRRLRLLAEAAILRYPIRASSIHFINHGENTTFRIESKDGRKYLLRIHRNDYHTKDAIAEELKWLERLSKAGLAVPKPVLSKNGAFVEVVEHAALPAPRKCSVFHWIDGRFIEKSVTPKRLHQVGQLLGDLQLNSPRRAVRHRRYWTADGLAGPNPKFGSIEALVGVPARQQELISEARKLVYRKLRRYEAAFPERQGLIHADLHFGNILSLGDQLGAIDFDDCGYGFHTYDLVIPLVSVASILDEKEHHRLPEFKEALLAGYTTRKRWDAKDEEIFPYLISSRKLAMLGWLNSRSDNPRLKKYLKGAVSRALKHFRAAHDLRGL